MKNVQYIKIDVEICSIDHTPQQNTVSDLCYGYVGCLNYRA